MTANPLEQAQRVLSPKAPFKPNLSYKIIKIRLRQRDAGSSRDHPLHLHFPKALWYESSYFFERMDTKNADPMRIGVSLMHLQSLLHVHHVAIGY